MVGFESTTLRLVKKRNCTKGTMVLLMPSVIHLMGNWPQVEVRMVPFDCGKLGQEESMGSGFETGKDNAF